MEIALVREPPMMLVWADDVEGCIARAELIQSQILQPFIAGMLNGYEKLPDECVDEVPFEDGPENDNWIEENVPEPPRRPYLIQSGQVALTLMLIIVCLAAGWRNLVIDIMTDHNYMRLAFLLVVGIQAWLALVRGHPIPRKPANSRSM